MPILWSQFLNAVTMVSPLIALISGCKRKHIHKNPVGKTLIIHIPISTAYHLSCALNGSINTINTFKTADLSLIHIYAITVHEHMHEHSSETLQNVSKIMNAICIFRVCKGYEDTLFRMASLYAGSYNLVKRTQKKYLLIGLSLASSVLFYFDDHIRSLGHPTFHILLGFIHNHLFNVID